jgi:tripartite-type tricarboxylate transporter receptor subunit TctC
MTNLLGTLATCLGLLVCAAHAQAQSPAGTGKPIRLIVPFPPGGVADGVARGIGQRLSAALGQTVIVDNKPGANTILGAEQAAHAPADGSTLLLATDSTLSINPLLYARLPYDPAAFVPLALVARTVECVLVSATLPVDTLADLVRASKAAPGKYNYGSFGRGSNAHLTAEAFKADTGADLTHVPYKGVAEVMPALISGEVHVLFASQSAALPHIRAGKVKAVAVLADQRQATLPGVPTAAEAGYGALQQSAWFGVVAPPGTPRPVAERLGEALSAIAASHDFKERVIAPNGLQVAAGGSARLLEVLKADRDKYARQVQAAKLLPE